MRKASSRARRTLGWLLSALVLTVYFSPQVPFLRTLPGMMSVAEGEEAQFGAPFPLMVEVQSADASMAQTLGDLEGQPSVDRATISLLGLLPLKEVDIEISEELRLYPGGQAVGVALHTQGVLVVGTSDLSGAGSSRGM